MLECHSSLDIKVSIFLTFATTWPSGTNPPPPSRAGLTPDICQWRRNIRVITKILQRGGDINHYLLLVHCTFWSNIWELRVCSHVLQVYINHFIIHHYIPAHVPHQNRLQVPKYLKLNESLLSHQLVLSFLSKIKLRKTSSTITITILSRNF